MRKRVGETDVRLLAHNGSVPGPTLRVRQGLEIVCRFVNGLDLDTTVHWDGLRHDYLYDGVPRGGRHGGMQDPVRPGRDFTYRLRFPDPGVYWYHPHMREDYTQEMGLYSNVMLVNGRPRRGSSRGVARSCGCISPTPPIRACSVCASRARSSSSSGRTSAASRKSGWSSA